MADDTPSSPGPFDVQTIKALVQLMTRHDLSEVDLRDGAQRLRLRRGRQQNIVTDRVPAPAPQAAPAHTGNATAAAPPAPPAKKLLEIKSPTVGTFYVAAKPDAPPFVRVGDRVSPDTVVGLIEAMKLYNEILAECSGVIVEIIAQNQQAVEYDQVLFRVDPAG